MDDYRQRHARDLIGGFGIDDLKPYLNAAATGYQSYADSKKPTPTPTPGPTPSAKPSPKSNTALYVGLGIAGVLGAVLIAFFARKRK